MGKKRKSSNSWGRLGFDLGKSESVLKCTNLLSELTFLMHL